MRDRRHGVEHGLAALGKQTPHHLVEQFRVVDGNRRRTERQSHHGRAHFRWRAKRAWRERQDQFDVSHQLDQHGERAVISRAWPPRDAIGDLPLEHQGRVRKAPGLALCVDQHPENRGREIVGDVADQPRAARGRSWHRCDETGQVLIQDIASHDLDRVRHRLIKRGGKGAVDLDCHHPCARLREWACQFTPPPPDLQEEFVGLGRDGGNQLGDPGSLEEVLSEPLPHRRFPRSLI